MALVMRIKFPPTYPLIYKTLRIDSSLTVSEAIKFIHDTLQVPPTGEQIGLYLASDQLWLDNDKTLSSYPELQDAEEVEFRNFSEAGGGPPSKAGKDESGGGKDGGCCTIL
mmetsp:Transcript_47731/g.120163  ORF Transcript_47731/g.120163 Transcript_47731/m.120163 type:complete len:111 (-) Transcript_47731:495-827(-)|eukprot:CAMPEP_0177654130 /NCGR_PEP_ID=MMETSP0447-20121125/14139_1 /TAXON_ID=0 /ORGANISM="Stygamoeba regulata, Strain BSH-02190019" /LENGTH=110 /DNA_ID=CAMNT_0019157701 /DNA_START=87 /DNA_END=419 /DNA_ORIENTATION=-